MKRLTYHNWKEANNNNTIPNFQGGLDVLKWAYEQYPDDIIYSCSFGAEGIVLIDLIHQVKRDAKIVFLDTDVHFAETYDLIDIVKERYPTLNIQMIRAKLSLEQQAKQYGDELWKYNPNQCCSIRKIEPLAEELNKVSAWISGLRREQSETRRHVEFINKDERFQSVKVCPLIHWTWAEVWNYINSHNLPYNALHDRGYPSIGCEYCTLPSEAPGDTRSGRWSNSTKTECGLHQT